MTGKLTTPALKDGPNYTGHVADAATGLIYMQARYYDPACGCFLSRDPVTVNNFGGNFNRYWYANANPYRFTDPDGRDPDPGMDPYRLSGGFVGVRSSGPISCDACDIAPPAQKPLPKSVESIEHTMSKFHISNPTNASIEYFPGLTGKDGKIIDGANLYPGVIYLGSHAFISESYLAGVIGHEIRHEVQRKEKRYGLATDEAEAYRYNIENAVRFHTTPDHLREIQIEYHRYFDGLSDEQQERVNSYDYSYP